MSEAHWAEVDGYICSALAPPDPALDAALAATAAAGMAAINVAPNQGKLLHILARAIGARRILEIGTLGGYSTIWLGRALPEGGRLVSLEYDARHAEVARTNISHAGLAGRVEVRVGPALTTLPSLAAEIGEPHDLVFIDADKANNAGYFDWALKLTRVGGLIVVDNVVRAGLVLDADSPSPDVQGTRELYRRVAAEPRVSATAVQTVGSKGWDGFLLALVLA